MAKQEPVENPECSGTIGDPRVFRFAITCRDCDFPFHTLQAAKIHFVDQCPYRPAPKIRCGCCGATFRNWGKCATHLNVKWAHLRGPARSIVISTTSSSEGESQPAPSRKRALRRSPTVTPQSATSARANTSLHVVTAPVLRQDLPSPPASSALANPPVLSASDIDLSIPGLDAALLPDVQDLSTPSPPGHEGDPSIASVASAGTSQLQIVTRARDPADVWRERFYSLAAVIHYFVTELANPSHGMTLCYSVPRFWLFGRRTRTMPSPRHNLLHIYCPTSHVWQILMLNQTCKLCNFCAVSSFLPQRTVWNHC